MTKLSIATYSSDAEIVMLLINEAPEVTPKKSLAEETAYVVSLPFAKLTVIVPDCSTKSASVMNTLAPIAVTPGLKVSVSGSVSSVLNAKLPGFTVSINKPCAEDAVQDGVPLPKSPLNVMWLPGVNELNVVVDDILSFANDIAVVNVFKLL
jgi:hypothetical protein